MKLLICCATPGELKTVKTQIKSLNLKTNLDIFYLCTGIGNYETIYTLTNYLTQTEDKENIFLINIGICGYRNKSDNKPKFIQVGRIKNLYTQKELLPPIPFIFGKIESIYSSDKIVLKSPNEEYGFVDMESRGIEICCNKYIIPHIFLKVPYDRVGQETKIFNKDKACKALSENIDYKKLIENILKFNAY